MNKGKAPILGANEKGVTVRPDIWHDPNGGAIGRFIIFCIVAAIFVIYLLALASSIPAPPPLKDSPYAQE